MRWNIYTLKTSTQNLNGVMLRGRIRKFGIENNIVVFAENTEDIENGVRIALLSTEAGSQLGSITEFLRKIIPDIEIKIELCSIQNPILSKLKCNDESRYEI